MNNKWNELIGDSDRRTNVSMEPEVSFEDPPLTNHELFSGDYFFRALMRDKYLQRGICEGQIISGNKNSRTLVLKIHPLIRKINHSRQKFFFKRIREVIQYNSGLHITVAIKFKIFTQQDQDSQKERGCHQISQRVFDGELAPIDVLGSLMARRREIRIRKI